MEETNLIILIGVSNAIIMKMLSEEERQNRELAEKMFKEVYS